MTYESIPLNKLVIWAGNVRKTGADNAIDELAASIAAHGLLTPLTVQKGAKGRMEVVAGQRRLKALQRLADAGKLEKSHPVDCVTLADGADPSEVSLAENVVRAPMHPADQFEAWRDLIQNGATIADIAARFGVSEATVTKRMKLARVSPAIFDKFRAGEISLEQLQAFTVSDDHPRQERVWEGLQGWRRNPDGIRAALTEGEIPATDKRVRFVTLEAYEAAGGAVKRDLFDDENAGYILNPELLGKLVADKLAEASVVIQDEGWKWVEVRDEFDWQDRQAFRIERGQEIPLSAEEEAERERLIAENDALTEKENEEGELSDAENARYHEIQEQLDALDDRPRAYSPEIKAVAGAVITLGYDGSLEIERGLIRKQDAPSTGKEERNAASGSNDKAKPAFSAALIESLTLEKTAAIQAALATNPKVALAALVYTLANDHFHHGRSSLKISATTRRAPKGSDAEHALDKLENKWARTIPAERWELWPWCLEQKEKTLLDLLAFLVAGTVDAVQAGKDGYYNGGDVRHADKLAEALGLSIRDWFKPTAENYFGKVSKDQILSDLSEIGVNLSQPIQYHKLKKGEAAKAAEKEMQKAMGEAWLPQPMRPLPETEDTGEVLDDDLEDLDEDELEAA